jgi:hypothetical protein
MYSAIGMRSDIQMQVTFTGLGASQTHGAISFGHFPEISSLEYANS